MAFGSAVNSGHVDGNQNFSIVAVQGTLGTADTSGTAFTIPIGADPNTGAMYVNNIGASSSGGSNVNIITGSSVGTILGGTLQNLTSGTLNALASGTITTGTIVRTAPASSSGSLTAAGTINLLGSNTDAASVDIQGTWVGTGFFEGESGTSNWFLINAVSYLGSVANTITSNGDYLLNTAGLSGARLRLSYSSGTLTYNTQTTPFAVPSYYLMGGSVTNLGTISNIATGTLNAITTISNLTNGSINILTGSSVFTKGTISGWISSSGTANWTTATSLNSTVNLAVTNNPSLIVSVTSSGSLTGGSISFSVTDTNGTYIVNGLQSDTLLIGTSFSLAGTNLVRSWAFNNLSPYNFFLANLNAVITGTGTALVAIDGNTSPNATPIVFSVLPSGTITTIIAGTQNTLGTVSNLNNGSVILQSGTLTTGTLQNLVTGTINALASGTVSIGTVTGKDGNTVLQTANPVSIGGTDAGGTVRTVLVNSAGAMSVSGASAGTFVNLSTGTLNTIIAGTQNTLGTVGVINAGSVVITLGTVVGATASKGTPTTNPVLIAGTDVTGTVYAPLVNSAGAVSVTGASAGTFVNLSTGTLNTIIAGTQNTLGTVGVINNGTLAQVTTVSNLTNGSVVVTAGTDTISGGTIQNLNNGTLALVTTITNLNNGTINLGSVVKSVVAPSAGSFTAAGTINITGSQNDSISWDIGGTWVGTGFFEGQIGTSAWFGIPSITNTGITGTQTTGNGDFFTDSTSLTNSRFRFTFSSGTLTYNVQPDNFQSPFFSLYGGSLANLGSVTNIGQLYNAGTIQNISAGTITTLSNLTNGSIILQSGTLSTGTLQNLVSGTVNALAAGTITTGTISMTTGTLNGGTLVNLNYGTVQIDPFPSMIETVITSYGTTGTTGAAVFGTLVAAVGAGTTFNITGYQIVVEAGTVACAILNGTFAQTYPTGGTNMITRGLFVPGGGIARDRAIPFVSGTNGTICYWMGGAGTVYFQVDYWSEA